MDAFTSSRREAAPGFNRVLSRHDENHGTIPAGLKHDIKGNVSGRLERRDSPTTLLSRIPRRSRECGFSFLSGQL